MKPSLLEHLVCPSCRSALKLKIRSKVKNEIKEGTLMCSNCDDKFKISRGITRFVVDTTKDFVRTDKYKMAAEILIRNDSKIDFNISPVKNKKDIQNRILNFLYPDIDEDLYLK